MKKYGIKNFDPRNKDPVNILCLQKKRKVRFKNMKESNDLLSDYILQKKIVEK